MRTKNWIYALATGLMLTLAGCDDGSSEPSESDGARGNVGKADLVGSCQDACGGPSDGTCWCDDQCAEFGDCCEDKAAVCDGGSTCEGESPAGCISTGCGDGEVCSTETDACIASACDCDASTGLWLCTADCGGGECVPADDTGGGPSCEGENPAGCSSTGCDAGEVCSTQTDACIASACSCDETSGTWICTADCGGGECVPEDDTGGEPSCEGENPADACIEDGACIPSACDCVDSVWLCTSDCSGGTEC